MSCFFMLVFSLVNPLESIWCRYDVCCPWANDILSYQFWDSKNVLQFTTYSSRYSCGSSGPPECCFGNTKKSGGVGARIYSREPRPWDPSLLSLSRSFHRLGNVVGKVQFAFEHYLLVCLFRKALQEHACRAALASRS